MLKQPLIAVSIAACISLPACAHNHESDGIQSPKSKATLAPFDIIHTKITTEGNVATFHMAVSGKAGLSKPTPTGQLAGSDVFSYVWPTSIDSYEVGFEKKAGILALAVTSHPDLMIHRSMMKMVMAIDQMMAMYGTVTGWCYNQMNNAVKMHWVLLIYQKVQNHGYLKPGRACLYF